MAGLLWVSSSIVEPSKLSAEHFDDWYENEHAREVLVLPGVPSGIRYTALSPARSPQLITYEFPSLSYTTSPAFQAVANQAPSPDLVDRIYAHTAFDIRFYAELPSPSPHPSPRDSQVPTLASIALQPVAGSEADFLLWFAKDLAEGLARVPGFVRLRRFELASGIVRERNAVSVSDCMRYLVLASFEGGAEVRDEVERCVAKPGLTRAEVGWFGVTKEWAEGEVQSSPP